MKKLLAILSMILALAAGKLCALAMGQEVRSRPVQVGAVPPSPTLVTGWYTFSPQRQVNDASLGKLLSDIESHMPAGHQYRDAELGTWAHETTHGINSQYRVKFGAGVNAFYCLHNRGCVLREPKFNRKLVNQFVPSESRGGVWGLYMVGQSEWDEHPLYILDEWVAYINGAAVLQELYGSARTTRDGTLIGHDVKTAVEFAGYAAALLRAVDKYDPNYSDREKLIEFVAFNTDRTIALNKLHPQPELKVYATVYWQGPCGNGGDGWPTYSGGYFQRPPVPYSPGPAPPPITQPAQPPIAPVKPRPPELVKGPQGDKGDPGPRGETGPAGPQGPPGKDADPIDVSAIVKEVIKNLPPQQAPQVDQASIVAAVLAQVNQCKCQAPAEDPKRPEPQPGIFFDLRPHQPQR